MKEKCRRGEQVGSHGAEINFNFILCGNVGEFLFLYGKLSKSMLKLLLNCFVIWEIEK